MAKPINCKMAHSFQVALTTPNSARKHAPPALGAISGITLRLASTKTGAAIHANVDALAATEAADAPGLFYVVVSTTLLTTHILPLGVGAEFYAIWSKSGVMDMEWTRFLVASDDEVT